MANGTITDIVTPWMNAQQAADYLQVALGTVRNWTSAHFVPHVKRGGLVRYHRDDLDRWMRKAQCRGRASFADKSQPP